MSSSSSSSAAAAAVLQSPQHGYDIQDKVVLVTGASRGIGAAFVHSLLQHDARKVYAAVRNVEQTTHKLQQQQQQQEDKVTVIYLDLSKPETIQQAAAIATDVHVVINNAGVLTQTSPLDEQNCIPNLQYELSINCFGLIHMAQQFVPILQRNGGGVLVQINSVASFRSAPGIGSTYAASKAAAYSITQSLRHMLLQQQTPTQVISVHPGPIATDMIHQIGSTTLNDMAAPAKQVAEQVIAAMKQQGGVFLVYPDAKSKQLQKVYQEFATAVIEPGNMYND